MFVPERIIHNFDKKQVLLVLPFFGPLSFEIRSRLQKCLKTYIPCCSLKVVYQSKSIISNLLNFKDVVNTKLSSHIFDHMLLDGHKASFNNFSILLKENNAFKLQLKESLFISRDKPIYSFSLELFD